MGASTLLVEGAEEEIAREMARLHEHSYERPADNPRVTIHEDFVAVVMEVELTASERALAEAGNGAAVRATREEFAHAIRAAYESIVERATGRCVASFTSNVNLDADRSWSAEVFLLAPPTPQAAALGH
jgi:uncharacterized protein YbcI